MVLVLIMYNNDIINNKFIKFVIISDYLPKRFLNIIVFISLFQLFEYIYYQYGLLLILLYHTRRWYIVTLS